MRLDAALWPDRWWLRQAPRTVPVRRRSARSVLVVVEGRLRIAGKRVDIVNCDAAFGNIQLLP